MNSLLKFLEFRSMLVLNHKKVKDLIALNQFDSLLVFHFPVSIILSRSLANPALPSRLNFLKLDSNLLDFLSFFLEPLPHHQIFTLLELIPH